MSRLLKTISFLMIFSVCSFSLFADVVKSNVSSKFIQLNQTDEQMTAKSYVHDGLVAMWDGIENVGYDMHDNNATVWTDLAGNGYDAEIVGVFGSQYYWKDNAYVRMNNGVGGGFGYIDITELMLLPVREAKFTVEMVTSSPTYSADWTTQIFNLCTANNSGWANAIVSLVRREDNGLIFSPAFPTYRCNQTSEHQTKDETMTSSIVLNSNTYALFINGIGSRYGTTIITPDSSISGVFARLGSTAYAFRGHYHCYRIYNRPLTEAEIQHNYLIDKVRFNISD